LYFKVLVCTLHFHRLQTLGENEYCYMQATDYFVYSSVTLQTFKFILYDNLVTLL